MKLATYKDGSRDGQLVVVSRDLSTAHYATGIANTLQQALDDWNFIAPQLQDLYVTLNQGKARHAFPFDACMCMAPLPRAHQRFGALAYRAHAEQAWPQRQGPAVHPAAGEMLGAQDDFVTAHEEWGIAAGPGVAVVTGDLPMGTPSEAALERVRLVMLANDWTLPALAKTEVEAGLGLCQGQAATAFGPVAVTLDELGEAWRDGALQLSLRVACNDRKLTAVDAGDMRWHFGQLLAQACRTQALSAGAVVGSGPVSWVEGAMPLSHLKWGDTVRIEVTGRDGQGLFGAIAQGVAPAA